MVIHQSVSFINSPHIIGLLSYQVVIISYAFMKTVYIVRIVAYGLIFICMFYNCLFTKLFY